MIKLFWTHLLTWIINAAQVEILLNGQESTASPAPETQPQLQENVFNGSMSNSTLPSDFTSIPAVSDEVDRCIVSGKIATQHQSARGCLPEQGFNMTDNSTWDMISLGLEEPLPDQNVIDEL